ncbi:hypothetical protein F1559_002280 [Cyanidiococcus yangmingshanensis]|uniref:Derlin n=1 Tax=Cyanidiococcus yangmingshanensis TaxID=2690220 RepID=A0A7J7IGG2_9RHOD|nr:hypothetical protein F1559_002280 [Cyanidiococcus yangmingshanensis]
MASFGDSSREDLSLTTFYFSIPRVTRFWLSATSLLTVACGLGIVPARAVILDWERVVRMAELWRPLTSSLLLGPLGIGFLFDLVFLYRFSRALETDVFLGSAAEYTWMLVVVDLFLLIVSAVVTPIPTLGRPLMMAIMHVWSRNFPRERVHVFIFAVPAAYLSFALILINTLLMGGLDISGVLGVVCGHLFYFLHTIYPSLQGSENRKVINTPQFMYRLFGEQLRRGFISQREPESRVRNEAIFSQIRGHRWGAGRRLGATDGVN